MLDAESARGSCVDGGRTIEYDVAYLPYDVAVDAARGILRNQQFPYKMPRSDHPKPPN